MSRGVDEKRGSSSLSKKRKKEDNVSLNLSNAAFWRVQERFCLMRLAVMQKIVLSDGQFIFDRKSSKTQNEPETDCNRPDAVHYVCPASDKKKLAEEESPVLPEGLDGTAAVHRTTMNSMFLQTQIPGASKSQSDSSSTDRCGELGTNELYNETLLGKWSSERALHHSHRNPRCKGNLDKSYEEQQGLGWPQRIIFDHCTLLFQNVYLV